MKVALSRRRFVGIGAGAFAGAALGTPAIAQAPIVMKLGTATINDTQQEWLKRFAATVERETSGRIKAEIYPASQLGQTPRMIEGTQFGQIQGWIGPPEFLAGVDTRFEVLSAPGVLHGMKHARKTLSNYRFRDAFLKLGTNKGLRPVDVLPYSTYAFIMREPIREPAGFRSKKIRVFAAALQLEQVRRLGAGPIPMALGEVLPALQQGTIDGVMSGVPAVTPLRFYDSAKYAIETGHGVAANTAVLSKLWLDKLPSELQTIVTNAGAKTGGEIFDWTEDYNAAQEAIWQKNGGEVIRFSPEAQAQVTGLFAGMAQTVLKDKPEVLALYQLLVEAAA